MGASRFHTFDSLAGSRSTIFHLKIEWQRNRRWWWWNESVRSSYCSTVGLPQRSTPYRIRKPRPSIHRCLSMLIAVLVALLLPSNVGASAQCQFDPTSSCPNRPAQCRVLCEFYQATNGPAWDLDDSWGSSDVCNFTGVLCNPDHYVTEM